MDKVFLLQHIYYLFNENYIVSPFKLNDINLRHLLFSSMAIETKSKKKKTLIL